MNKAKISLLLARVKKNTITLRSSYQLPLYLTKLILDLNVHSDEVYIKDLMNLSTLYLRVKNFYKKFPQFEEVYKKEITEFISVKYL